MKKMIFSKVNTRELTIDAWASTFVKTPFSAILTHLQLLNYSPTYVCMCLCVCVVCVCSICVFCVMCMCVVCVCVRCVCVCVCGYISGQGLGSSQ